MNKPVIIDYSNNRELLKQEFTKIANTPGFKESVRKALEVLYNNKVPPEVLQRHNIGESYDGRFVPSCVFNEMIK